MTVVKSGTKRMSISQVMNIADDVMVFGRLEPKRPTVVRVGDKVKKCFLYEGTKECLKTRCFWQMCGTCHIYEKIKKDDAKPKPRTKKIVINSKVVKPKKASKTTVRRKKRVAK